MQFAWWMCKILYHASEKLILPPRDGHRETDTGGESGAGVPANLSIITIFLLEYILDFVCKNYEEMSSQNYIIAV